MKIVTPKIKKNATYFKVPGKPSITDNVNATVGDSTEPIRLGSGEVMELSPDRNFVFNNEKFDDLPMLLRKTQRNAGIKDPKAIMDAEDAVKRGFRGSSAENALPMLKAKQDLLDKIAKQGYAGKIDKATLTGLDKASIGSVVSHSRMLQDLRGKSATNMTPYFGKPEDQIAAVSEDYNARGSRNPYFQGIMEQAKQMQAQEQENPQEDQMEGGQEEPQEFQASGDYMRNGARAPTSKEGVDRMFDWPNNSPHTIVHDLEGNQIPIWHKEDIQTRPDNTSWFGTTQVERNSDTGHWWGKRTQEQGKPVVGGGGKLPPRSGGSGNKGGKKVVHSTLQQPTNNDPGLATTSANPNGSGDKQLIGGYEGAPKSPPVDFTRSNSSDFPMGMINASDFDVDTSDYKRKQLALLLAGNMPYLRAEKQKAMYDNTPITLNQYDAHPYIQTNKDMLEDYMQRVSGDNYNANPALYASQYGNTARMNDEAYMKTAEMNNQARTQYETRLAEQNRYNNGEYARVADINAANRAARRDQMGRFFNNLNDMNTQDMNQQVANKQRQMDLAAYTMAYPSAKYAVNFNKSAAAKNQLSIPNMPNMNIKDLWGLAQSSGMNIKTLKSIAKQFKQ